MPPFTRVAWSLRSSMIRRGLRTAFSRPVDIPDDLVAAAREMSYGVFGTDDLRWDSASAHSYEPVPNARLEILAGIGHTPMFEAPAVISKLLLEFATSGEGPPIGCPG